MGTDVFKIINDVPVFSGYIKSDEEVDNDTLDKIRTRYSEAEEMKLHRQKLNGENHEEYEIYNIFVEQCREEGRIIKQANQARLARLTPYEIEDGNDTKTIMVEDENI